MKWIYDETKRKNEIISFTLIVIVVSWVPVIIQNPLSRDYIPQDVFDDPQRLFVQVEGLEIVHINITDRGYEAVYQNSEPIYVTVTGAKEYGLSPDEYYATKNFSVENRDSLTIEQINATYLEIKKDGQLRKVIYWYYRVGENNQFFLFYVPGKNMEVVLFSIEASNTVSTDHLIKISSSIINAS